MRLVCCLLGTASVVSSAEVELAPLRPHNQLPVTKSLEAFKACQRYEADEIGPKESKHPVVCALNPPTGNGVAAVTFPKQVTVYFVRHAKSEWNEVTEKSLKKMLYLEAMKGNVEGFEFLQDARLADNGIESALELRKALIYPERDNRNMAFLAGELGVSKGRKSIFVTSNLRRAILTALIVFQDRIIGNPEYRVQIDHLHIVSALQEETPNSDSTPVTPPNDLPWLDFAAEAAVDQCPFELNKMKDFLKLSCANDDENHRPEPVDRYQTFCDWMIEQVKSDPSVTDFVITGHSIWIRTFFNRFGKDLANGVQGQVKDKKKKLSNQGIFKFTIGLTDKVPDEVPDEVPDKGQRCTIVPDTTIMVNGQFDNRPAGYFGL